jgi:hypothetical protein
MPTVIATDQIGRAKINFSDLLNNGSSFWRGDTILPRAIAFGGSVVTEANPIVSAAMDIRRNGDRVLRYSSVVDDGDILLTLPDYQTVQFPQQVLDIPGCQYDYDIEITLQNGVVRSYIYGKILVKEDYTKPNV